MFFLILGSAFSRCSKGTVSGDFLALVFLLVERPVCGVLLFPGGEAISYNIEHLFRYVVSLLEYRKVHWN